MKDELNVILENEIKAIESLLEALEEQHEYLLKKDAVTLEACVKNIENRNREIADFEVKRRQLTKGESMGKIVDEIKDEKLEQNYRDIRKLLQITSIQKDTNELLIKQGLGFTSRILNILNPDRGSKTYNAYGKVR
jgi:flagellar biosynthesis/type III secretory pathway chaperone